MNVYSVFPTYGLYVGKLPSIRWFEVGDEEILDFVVNGITDEKWAAFNEKHGGAYARGSFYSGLSSAVLAVTTTALIVKYVERRVSEERDLEKNSEKVVEMYARQTDAFAELAREESKTTAFDDAMNAWAKKYAEDHHGKVPSDTSSEYLSVRSAFKKAFEK
jgi:hypothetical protein